jgi:hypothetical protein
MAKQNLNKDISDRVNWAFDQLIYGKADLHLVESGVSVFIDQNRATAVKPKTRAVVAMNPTASILIKKKAFSTYKATNDLRWMDKTEKMLIRATKALFALKVAQLRSYESLTKFDKFYDDTGDLNFTMLADLISSSRYLKPPGSDTTSNGFLSALGNFGVAAGISASADDVIKIVRRNAFSTSNTKTTWIVDPDDVQNYGTGPGTGVIELCTFTNISTSTGITSDSKSSTFDLIDPHRILNVIEDDVEMAIEESLYGTLGLMNDLAYSGIGGEYIDPTLIVSSAFEVFGLGALDPTIDVDYIRDRLRIFYLGKWIVNVGDGVHIYIAGNKSVTGNSNIDIDSFDTAIDRSYFQMDEVILEAERKLYTNQHISKESYKNIRMYSNNSFIMRHVFGGYISSVSEKYSPTGSSISVSCDDNMGWLKRVRFMEDPGLIDPRAPLEDPLTPYDIKTISSSSKLRSSGLDLLPENKALLKSGLLSFDNGLLSGYNANETNIYQGHYSGSGSMRDSTIMQHPSGMVYRWRTGVLGLASPFSPTGDYSSGAASANAETSRQKYGFSVTNTVVANLDVANVISLMVTGQPYNMETFTQLSVTAMNVINKNGNYAPNEALSYVLDSIRNQNPFYGNFKPFRMITMSEQTINRFSGDSVTLENAKSEVTELRRKKNTLKQKIRTIEKSTPISAENAAAIATSRLAIEQYDISLNKQINATYNNVNFFGGKPSTAGGVDTSDTLDINFNIFGQNKVLKKDGNLESDHDLTRAMMSVAATRRIEDVKLNRDQNLLIVSDQYDLNPDIKAYILNLRTSNFQLIQNNFMNVYDRCSTAASATMMEFFCNTQGHLEIRPPQFNKTPLSVLNALYKYQKTTDRKIVPDFLFTMFNDRISSLKLEIHSLNLRIGIIAMMLGRFPDSNLIPGVPLSGSSSFGFFGINFLNSNKDVTEDLTYLNLDTSEKTLINTSSTNISIDPTPSGDGDILDGNISTNIGNFDNIVREFGQGSDSYIIKTPTSIADSSIYDSTLESLLNPRKDIGTNTSQSQGNTKGSADGTNTIGSPSDVAGFINNIVKSFLEKSGINPASGLNRSNNEAFSDKDLLFSSSVYIGDTSGKLESALDKIFKDLEQTISKRNSLVDLIKKNEEKQKELEKINSDLISGFSENNTEFWENEKIQNAVNNAFPERGDTDAKFTAADWAKSTFEFGKKSKRAIDATRDFLTGGANKGTLFDHLIDDDTRNLLGPGSGKRFVIFDEQIESYDVREVAPSATRVDIFGTTPLVNDSMKQVFGGENFIQWGGAVDYDLWRQYGYIHKPIQDAPFISDAETQAKPLALQHLAIQRAAIFTGSVAVAGNEYYQPGDTIYIPSKGLLFYVNSVTHSFGYGSSFKTNLALMYGHVPGSYLPTQMDIIGQSYSKDILSQGTYFAKRTTNSDSKYHPLQPDCAIRFPTLPAITDSNISYLLSHKNNMVKFYNMVTDISNGLLTAGRLLVIRGFVRNADDAGENEDVKQKMLIMSQLFQNPVMLSQKLDSAAGDDLLADILQPTQALFNINAGSGMNKETTTMFLPNSVPVYKVKSSQIILQSVNLSRDNGSGESAFKVFKETNLTEFSKFYKLSQDGSSAVQINDIDQLNTTFGGYFARGGPSQTAWLDMEDILKNISSGIPLATDYEKVIEVGIIDLDSSKVALLMRLK